MKNKIVAIMLALTVAIIPCTANAAIMDVRTIVEAFQGKVEMTSSGYTQVNLNFRALPDLGADVLDVADINTEVEYCELNDDWVMAIYDDRIGFFAKKYIGDEEVEIVEEEQDEEESYDAIYSASYFRKMGVIDWNSWHWTWYSENVLPGGGLNIPGRHVDDSGFIRDENGYICLASSTLSKGCVVSTPFGGEGKIYDSGCDAGTLDVYVSW